MDEADDEPLPILESGALAPGWQEDNSVLCIGGRTPLDEAAATMLAGLLKKHGLNALALKNEAISPGHIVSLDANNAACLPIFSEYWEYSSSSSLSRAPSSAHCPRGMQNPSWLLGR